MSPNADVFVNFRHRFTTGISCQTNTAIASVVSGTRIIRGFFNKISELEPSKNFFRDSYLQMLDDDRRVKELCSNSCVRNASIFVTACRNFETLRRRISFSYTESGNLDRMQFENLSKRKFELQTGSVVACLMPVFCDRVNGIAGDSRSLLHVT
jgi:hypothetical protein